MKVTKFGHCCLLLEIDGVKLLTDPGNMSTGEADVRDLDAVLITHEHADHFHIDSVKEIIKNNPHATIISNSAVGVLLGNEGIGFTRVGDGESTTVKGIAVEGHGKTHAIIYGEMGKCENTGFMIAGKFFFPGDNLYNPGLPVDVLALPTSAPWLKFSEAIDYAKAVKPRMAFPVHDALYKDASNGFVGHMCERFLAPVGITFISLAAGETKEF